jgi:hypothetical protein
VLLIGLNDQSPTLQTGLCEALDADVAAYPRDASPTVKRNYTNSPLRNNTAPPADQQRPVLPASLAETRDFRILKPILAGNAVVFLGGKHRETDGHVYAVSRADRRLLWDTSLPAMPLLGGPSLTRAGDVLVPLVDGRVVCIGTEE